VAEDAASVDSLQSAAGRALKSIQTKNKLMARSLTKARELKKVDRRTAAAEKEVEALKSQKQALLEEIQRLRGDPGARKCSGKPCRRLILTSHHDPCEDINFARFRLQVVIDELAEAQAILGSILRFRDYLKMDLAEDSD